MREVFVLENMASCKDFIDEHAQKGFTNDDFLGVGSFSSSVLANENSGLQVKVIPQFLETDLIEYIIQGHVDVFDKEPILIQPQPHLLPIPVFKWLVLGKQAFLLKKENASLVFFSSCEKLVEEFVNQYFSSLFHQVSSIQVKAILFLLDIEMFKNYLFSVFQKEERLKEDFKQNHSDASLEQLIMKEIIYFISSAFFKSKVVIIPDQKKYFKLLMNIIHEIKIELNTYAPDVYFKL